MKSTRVKKLYEMAKVYTQPYSFFYYTHTLAHIEKLIFSSLRFWPQSGRCVQMSIYPTWISCRNCFHKIDFFMSGCIQSQLFRCVSEQIYIGYTIFCRIGACCCVRKCLSVCSSIQWMKIKHVRFFILELQSSCN